MGGSARPTRTSIRAKLILLSATCLMLFGFGEVGSCFYLKATSGYDGEHLLNYRFDPYKIIELTPDFVDTRGKRHNAQGFRRNEDTPTLKPEGTLRVFLMGGSTAYGLESLSQYGEDVYPIIRNDETIDYYLERWLEQRMPGQRIEVINAAITSFYSHHHLIYLNQRVLHFDPDLVIFLDGFNDYYKHEKGFDQFRDYAYSERVWRFMREPSLDAWASYTGWWLFRRSHLVNVVGRGLRNMKLAIGAKPERLRIDPDAALEQMEVNAERNWVKMVERNGLILEHEGVDAIFALQPEIAFDPSKALSPLETKIFDEIAGHWPENYVEFKRRARPIVAERLHRAADVGGAESADLTDIYAAVEEDVYTDYCHLTPVGNRVLAEALGPQVERLLRARLQLERR